MSFPISCRYAMLICYLPPLPQHPFAIKQKPLSRLQLDRRLSLLAPEDARDLAIIEESAHWERIPLATSEQSFLAGARDALKELARPSLRDMLCWRLELRTVVAALRRRRRGLPRPAAGAAWGFGACTDHIRRNWEQPDFKLSHRYPWVTAADQCLRDDNPVGLERLLFNTVWNHYTYLAGSHHFDFEAVVLYVLRWNLVDRLARHDPVAATERFKTLLVRGLELYDGAATAPGSEGITHPRLT
jgi:hypothetical protein